MAHLGMANGAVFQLVPQRFGKRYWNYDRNHWMCRWTWWNSNHQNFWLVKGAFDGYTAGFIIFAIVVFIAIMGISLVKTRWRTTWELVLVEEYKKETSFIFRLKYYFLRF